MLRSKDDKLRAGISVMKNNAAVISIGGIGLYWSKIFSTVVRTLIYTLRLKTNLMRATC